MKSRGSIMDFYFRNGSFLSPRWLNEAEELCQVFY